MNKYTNTGTHKHVMAVQVQFKSQSLTQITCSNKLADL